jgi:outer membrane protein assembly factor BamB
LVFEDIKVNGSRVFVAVHNGFFYSLDISDGQVVWKTQVEPRSTLRIFFDNRDVLVDSSSLLISYNQLSGVEMWKKPIRIENALMLSDRKTIIGINYDDDSSRLIGIDLSNGDILFSNQIQVQKVSCIVETTKGILLSGEDLTLFNLEADRVIWQNQQISNLGCPFVFKENVYVKKELRDIYKYSILTGTLQSRIPIKWESSSKSNYLIMPIEFNDWMIIETNLRRIEFFRQ